MTLYDSKSNANYKTYYYYLLESSLPSTSGNKTVSVTLSGDPNAGGTAVSICDYTGAKSQVPEAGAKASSNSPVSCTLTTLTDNACVIAVGGECPGDAFTAGNSANLDVSIWDYTAQCGSAISSYTKTTAGSNTSSFSTSSGAMNIIAAAWEIATIKMTTARTHLV
jgi:hypothetical protein